MSNRLDMADEAVGNIAPASGVERTLYPETLAGGFTRVDGTVQFYTRVNALLRPEMTVLDFGAGRGKMATDQVPYRRTLGTLKGKVRKVIGMDVDPVVRSNPLVDEAVVIRPNEPLPLADASIDLIVSDWTFEHIDDPAFIAREFTRILKPGGWICARTPNRWGMTGIAANIVPNHLHVAVLRHLQPQRRDYDVFPTRYRMNTRSALRRIFDPQVFEHGVYAFNSEPTYFPRSTVMWGIGGFIYRFMPETLGTVLMVFLRKR